MTPSEWATREVENTLNAARAAILRHLQDEDFLPEEKWIDDSWKTRNYNSFLRDYWTLEVKVRESQWRELRNHFPNGRNAARLTHLQKGLTLAGSTEHSDPKVRELAAVFRELYLLPPRSRTVRRHEWLAKIENRRDWIEGLRRLREADPGVPDLDPHLARWIEKYPDLEAMTVGRTKKSKNYRWGDDYPKKDFKGIKPFDFQATAESRRRNRFWIKIGIAASVCYFAMLIGGFVFTSKKELNSLSWPAVKSPKSKVLR